MANAPLSEQDGIKYRVICDFGKAEYFLKGGWTHRRRGWAVICPTGKSADWPDQKIRRYAQIRRGPHRRSYAFAGSSIASCASQDDTVAGMKPTSPYRMNWVIPLSGPREPYRNSAAKNAITPRISMRATG